ncbi:MAG: gfo/Idh/MocA family oxidoreductase [Candidatus Omnitrophota bacterium]|nr:MAG: gfo/Idh/MocA family oxidoreductase [Candidatus Omnitrophota bacterium]
MSKMRVGVVGLGRLGSLHAKVYQESENCQLHAVCDIDETRLEQGLKELNVFGDSDYKNIFSKVDAVSITVPTKLHFPIAYDFLKHNIHVLVEKPITKNIREAEALIKIARKRNRVLQVGHIERFNSAFSSTKKIVSNPKFIECHRLSPFPNRSLDIGVVLDLMIHDIDIILGLINSKIKKIEAAGVSVLTEYEDIANARITFKNGCVSNLTASRVSDEWLRKIRIFQKDTYISLDYRQAQASIYKKNGSEITKNDLPIEKEEPLKKELESFLDCIINNKRPVVSGEVAREALKVALKIKNQIWRKSIF